MWIKQSTVLFGCILLVCLTIADCSKNEKKIGGVKGKKGKGKDIKKKVSSSRVPNGGRTGPMSGTWDSTLHMSTLPVMIPLPKKNKKSRKKKKTGKIKRSDEKKQKMKPQRKEANMNPKQKRAVIDLHDDVIKRMRREVDDSVFTEEEKRLRDDWFRLDEEHEHNIPSIEAASFVPNDLKYIYDAAKTLADAYETLTQVKKEHSQQKRSVEESEEGEDSDKEILEIDQEQDTDEINDKNQIISKRDLTDYDLVADDDIMAENTVRNMQVRDVSTEEEDLSDDVMEVVEEPHYHTIVTRDVPMNGDCHAEEEQLENAIKASKIVDFIVKELGIKKENIIEDTQKCIEETQKMKREFNERFRRHIIQARDLVNAPKHRRAEIMELKEMFDRDQIEGKKISAKSELCAKIEMQLTTLEVAEYFALSNAKEKLASCRSKTPVQQVNLSPGAVSFAEMKAGQGSPMPSLISSQPTYNEPQSSPMFTTITLQPQPQPAPRLPSISSFFQSSQTPQQQSTNTHEIGMQRHFDSPPNPSQSLPSVLYQPHAESHIQPLIPKMQAFESQRLNFGQPIPFNKLANYGEMVRQNFQIYKAQSPQQNMFIQSHDVQEHPRFEPVLNSMQPNLAPMRQLPSASAFSQQPSVVLPAYSQKAYLVVADQKHITASSPYISPPYPIINSFAKKSKNKLSHPDHHHSTTDQSNEDKEDWHSSLWFPGTTYSPPPSWLKSSPVYEGTPKQPTAPIRPLEYPPNSSPSQMPYLPFVPKIPENHPQITEIAGDKHVEGEPGMVAPYSSLKPYIPLRRQPGPKLDVAPYSSLKPYKLDKQQHTQGFISAPQSALLNTASAIFQPSMIDTYAGPQPQHEILTVGPSSQVTTINQQKPQPQPVPIGELPGWLGSVDAVKLPDDPSERLRGDGNDSNKNKDNNNNNKGKDKESDQAPKREYASKPETRSDVEKAVQSVNVIKAKIGTSPKAMELLLDNVKGHVKQNIELTQASVNKDIEMEKQFCTQQQSPQHASVDNVAQKSELDKRSDIRNMACENVKKKKAMDEAEHKSALEIKRTLDVIEMRETIMASAQYFAEISKDGHVNTMDLADLTRASRSSASVPN